MVVFFESHDFQMVWINTEGVLTNVVYMTTRRNVANDPSIESTMSTYLLAFISKQTVFTIASCTCHILSNTTTPYPTLIPINQYLACIVHRNVLNVHALNIPERYINHALSKRLRRGEVWQRKRGAKPVTASGGWSVLSAFGACNRGQSTRLLGGERVVLGLQRGGACAVSQSPSVPLGGLVGSPSMSYGGSGQ